MAAPEQEGEAPRSTTEIVAEVLKDKCRSNTFLKNVGLKSSSGNKYTKSNAAVSAQVLDLEGKLERSQQQSEAMLQEIAAMKKKAQEQEAAQAERDKAYELLLKKTEENDARFAHMLALFGGKTSGN